MMKAKGVSTRDTLFGGDLFVYQRKGGYRFSVDSVLLAHHALSDCGETLLDMGCGCGIMAFIMAHRCPDLKKVVGIEIQEGLANLARVAAEENSFSPEVSIVHGDILSALPKGSPTAFDTLISNPPYTPLGKGRVNPSSEKATCRHEFTLTLEALVARSAELIHGSGTCHFVYPVERLKELESACANHGLYPTRLRLVCSKSGDAPSRVLFSCSLRPSSMVTLPPLVVHKADGSLTDEVNRLFK